MDLLTKGSQGPQVAFLQLGLRRAGTNPGTPDGIFGTQTEQAVRTFQRSVGLSPDGIVGPRTWAALSPYLTGNMRYVVRPGDSYFKIAKRFQIPVDYLVSANPNVDPLQLRPGSTITVPLNFNIVSHEIPITSDILAYYVQGLTARYAAFLEAAEIGRSILGKPITAFRMGNGSNRVGYNASHHANEWITTPVLLTFLERYASAYARGVNIAGVRASDIFRQTTLHLIPMVNPDGVDLVTGGIAPGSSAYESAQVIAANYPSIPFPNGWKANIAGVDLNLNYPASWERAREIKFAQGFTSPAPRDYVGSAPLTEPESNTMVRYTQQNDFALTLAYHTQGNVIYWKYADYQPPYSLEIGQQLAKVSGYTLELTPDESANAGYKDWFIQTYNRPGYTVEVGLGVNPLPLSQFNEIYGDNEPLLVTAALATASG